MTKTENRAQKLIHSKMMPTMYYCLGQQIFTPTPFFKELKMSSQYAIAFDHCPKFGMFEITTCLFCSHVIVSRATFLSAWRKKPGNLILRFISKMCVINKISNLQNLEKKRRHLLQTREFDISLNIVINQPEENNKIVVISKYQIKNLVS